MATATAESLMTLEEFFALPEDPSLERDLIRGEVWERTMTKRNRWHSSSEPAVVHYLFSWNLQQPAPRGIVASGEAGCILQRDPATTIGIDVAYFPAGINQYVDEEMVWFDGAPLLAVEILSPSDKQDEIQAKIDCYLDAGVKLIWIIDTHFKTVVVYRPDQRPEMFVVEEELQGDPWLPGLRIRVADLFPA